MARQKQPIDRIVRLVPVCVTEFVDVFFELVEVLVRNLYSRQNAAEVGAVVAVVKQTDVPGDADGV